MNKDFLNLMNLNISPEEIEIRNSIKQGDLIDIKLCNGIMLVGLVIGRKRKDATSKITAVVRAKGEYYVHTYWLFDPSFTFRTKNQFNFHKSKLYYLLDQKSKAYNRYFTLQG